jgi:hypothetical protein
VRAGAGAGAGHVVPEGGTVPQQGHREAGPDALTGTQAQVQERFQA